MNESAQTEALKEVSVEDTSKQEMEKVQKIIRKSYYKIAKQLGQTPSKISMLSLLLCSEAHAQALVKYLKSAHIPQEISVDQFENYVASLTTDNRLGFFYADLTPIGRNNNKALHVSIEFIVTFPDNFHISSISCLEEFSVFSFSALVWASSVIFSFP